MGLFADASLITRYDGIFRLIQKRVADKIKLPIEIQLVCLGAIMTIIQFKNLLRGLATVIHGTTTYDLP